MPSAGPGPQAHKGEVCSPKAAAGHACPWKTEMENCSKHLNFFPMSLKRKQPKGTQKHRRKENEFVTYNRHKIHENKWQTTDYSTNNSSFYWVCLQIAPNVQPP